MLCLIVTDKTVDYNTERKVLSVRENRTKCIIIIGFLYVFMKFKYHALKLSLFIVVVFLFQIFFNGFTEMFILNMLSWQQPWRFLTAIFLHGGLGHLILNLFALSLFGSILEKFVGGNRMLLVFIAAGILANLVSVNFYDSSLGASGAIFGILGALILIRPMMAVWAFGMPMPIFVAGILWAGADLVGVYGFFMGNPIDNTGNLAHLSGLFFGLLFGIWLRRYFRQRHIRKINVSIDEGEIRNWEKIYMGR